MAPRARWARRRGCGSRRTRRRGWRTCTRRGGGRGALLHRDVKSSNVLLDEGLRARVSDVGLARPQRGATMTAGVGTFGYIDPEYFDSGERTRPRARPPLEQRC